MRCELCQHEGRQSRVYIGSTTHTAMHFPSYYDEAGRLHMHDNNRSTTTYRCSEGHSGKIVAYGSCWCGWQGEVY